MLQLYVVPEDETYVGVLDPGVVVCAVADLRTGFRGICLNVAGPLIAWQASLLDGVPEKTKSDPVPLIGPLSLTLTGNSATASNRNVAAYLLSPSLSKPASSGQEPTPCRGKNH